MDGYAQALDYIYDRTDHSANLDAMTAADLDLSRMERLLDGLGNPQDRFSSVHVAGTKGKSSTATMLAAMLRAGGQRTGLFISPHLNSLRERYQVDGVWIAEDVFARQVEQLRAVADEIPELTAFELMVGLAFCYFAEAGVDWAVVEVGLGGRLDATNVLMPRASVITPVSHDHMAILGRQISQIAAEKGGIIKPGVPVVLAPQLALADMTLRRMAAKQRSPVVDVAGWKVGRELQPGDGGQRLDVEAPDGRRYQVRVPLWGAHQAINAATALATIDVLHRQGGGPALEDCVGGLGQARLPGRFEVVPGRPVLVLDGAHNRVSARYLSGALGEFAPGVRPVLVLGVSAGKDIAGILRELLPGVRYAIMTQARHPRACQAERLAAEAVQLGYNMYDVMPDLAGALGEARERAGVDGLVVVTGSLFLVGEARAFL